MRRWLGIESCLLLLANALQAQEPAIEETQPDLPAFAPYPPGMFGDLLGIETFRQPVSGNTIQSVGPAAFRSSFKIAENESPRPLDRVFATGNFYSDAGRSFLPPDGSSANAYREMIGFEKTFLEGDASVGVRLPYFQLAGDPRLGETHIGDISVLFKYAFVNDRASGDLISGGLVVTAPTGPGLHLPGQSTVNPTFVQPWVGSIWNWKGLFVQNFLSVAVPTDARDVTLFFKDLAVGYWLYRSDDPRRLLTAVVPDAELHLNSPLDHHGLNSLPIGLPDMLDFTGGCYFFLRRAIFGIAVAVPLTGPKPYEYQISTNLNFRF